LWHGVPVIAAVFSADGRSVLTGTAQENAIRRWPVPVPADGDADSLRLSIQTATGMELEDAGGIRALDRQSWQEVRQRLEERGNPLP
jgi:hypothetical protein